MGSGRRRTEGGRKGAAKERSRNGIPWLWSCAVFVAHLLAYSGTLFPSIPGGDATELIFNGCQLSVPHPPGYPLFTLIEWVFIRIFGAIGYNPAYCANLAAAFLGSLAACFLFLAVAEITDGHVAPSIVASVLFGSSRLVWLYSIQAEVFSLNNLFASALFFLSARYSKSENKRCSTGLAYLGSFLCGLALTNQHTIVFYVATCACFVYYEGFETLFNPKRTLVLVLAFAAGLSPYAYLFLAPGFGEPGSWGDTSTVSGFLTHLLRREYGTFRLFSGADAEGNNLLLGLWRYWEAATGDDYGVGVVLAAAGVLSCLAGKCASRRPILLVFGSFCFYTVTFHHLANLPLSSELHLGVHARFWMQSHVALHILAGAGMSAICKNVVGRVGLSQTAGSGRPRAGADDPLLPLAVLLAALTIGARHRSMDESGNYVIRDAFRDVLDKFPVGSRVIVKGDLFTNSLRYLQQCEGRRTDVELVDQAMLTYRWFVRVQGRNFPSFAWPGTHYHPFEETGFSMRDLLLANLGAGRKPVFMLGGWNPQDPSVPGSYVHVPWGVADLVAPAEDPHERWDGSIWSWHKECEERELRPRVSGLPGHHAGDRWEAVVFSDSCDISAKEALHFLNHALANGDDLRALEMAEGMMSDHVEAGLRVKPHHYRNLGIARSRLLTHPVHNNAEMYNKTRNAFEVYLELADEAGERVQDREAIQQFLSG